MRPLPLAESTEFYYLPEMHPSRMALLYFRFQKAPEYYRDVAIATIDDLQHLGSNQPSYGDISYALSQSIPDQPELQTPDGSEFLDLDSIAIFRYFHPKPLSEQPPVQDWTSETDSLITAWVIWVMYVLALRDTVKRITHFAVRGRPKKGGG